MTENLVLEREKVEINQEKFLELSSVIENAPYMFMSRDSLLKRVYVGSSNNCDCNSNSGSGSSCGSHSNTGNSRSDHHRKGLYVGNSKYT